MTKALCMFLLTAACFPARLHSADSRQELFNAAGKSYEQGDYERAAAKYEQIAGEGILSPDLYYNLGNAYYRLGNRGKAMLWYERARRLAPRDEDIRHNLELARQDLEDEEGALWELLDRLLTPFELAWTVTALFWALCIAASLALWLHWPWRRWRLPFLAIFSFLFFASLWLGGRMHNLQAPWGVLVQAGVQVRSGPGEQFAVGFTAPPGQRVLILNQRGAWVEIGVPSRSLKGWVTEGAVEGI